jgi:hypothetical protein
MLPTGESDTQEKDIGSESAIPRKKVQQLSDSDNMTTDRPPTLRDRNSTV